MWTPQSHKAASGEAGGRLPGKDPFHLQGPGLVCVGISTRVWSKEVVSFPLSLSLKPLSQPQSNLGSGRWEGFFELENLSLEREGLGL